MLTGPQLPQPTDPEVLANRAAREAFFQGNDERVHEAMEPHLRHWAKHRDAIQPVLHSPAGGFGTTTRHASPPSETAGFRHVPVRCDRRRHEGGAREGR